MARASGGTLSVAALLSVAAPLPSSAGTFTFSDAEFADANWSMTTVLLFGASPTASASQSGAGGNPGAYRQCMRTFPPSAMANETVQTWHFRAGATINPTTDGAIVSVAYASDWISLPSAGAGGVRKSLSTGLAAVQAGALYLADNRVNWSPASWTTVDRMGLDAVDFVVLGAGPIHPDFGPGAAPITFGYFTANTYDPNVATGYVVADGIDNWLVVVETEDPCPPDLTTSAIPGQTGYGVPNGVLNNDDFFYYLAQFAAGNLAIADLTTGAIPGQPGYGVPNGVLNNDDFFYFLAIFAAGC